MPIDGLTPADAATLRSKTRSVLLPAGHRVFEAGLPCEAYVLVRSGRVRVHQLGPDGHEIVLYRLGPGDTCILNTVALLTGQPHAACAITEGPVQALLLSPRDFDAMVATSAGFRAFVFREHAVRIVGLMRLVQAVAFEAIGRRLAERLLDLARGHDRLAITHAELAVELGTAREVVSRKLKEFQGFGWLRTAKGAIVILERGALERAAGFTPNRISNRPANFTWGGGIA